MEPHLNIDVSSAICASSSSGASMSEQKPQLKPPTSNWSNQYRSQDSIEVNSSSTNRPSTSKMPPPAAEWNNQFRPADSHFQDGPSNNPSNRPSTSTMPPPSGDWNNQYHSPDAVSPKTNGTKCFSPFSQDDVGPFVEQLLPFVRASAYNWFHLQAAKRKHYKEFDRKMSAEDENRKLVELQNDRDELKVNWASRLLGKIKKDVHNDHKDAFIAAISGAQTEDCILSVADQKGKMRRIDCLRQADKVWRLDLVTLILFKGIPLESTDGERLERCDSCKSPQLCINPFHMAITVRGLDIFMAKYLKDVNTKISLSFDVVKAEVPGPSIKSESGDIVAPHAVLGTSSTHCRVWEQSSSEQPTESVVLTYDPQEAAHTYFGGRGPFAQQSNPNPYSYFANKDAVDNNYFDARRSVLCLPPPPPSQSCLTALEFSGPGTSDSQQGSEDSNDEPLEKRSREQELSSQDSPNSSLFSTNDEVRRIVENAANANPGGLILGQSSTIWSPSGQYARVQASQAAMGTNRIRTDFRNEISGNTGNQRPTAFRPAKPVRRMTVNAGNHGDVGVVVVDERNQNAIHGNRPTAATRFQFTNEIDSAQSLANALHSLKTSTTVIRESPIGRKRTHQDSPLDVLSDQCVQDVLKNAAAVTATGVSPPHAAVANLISRESSGLMGSPTKFTTARGDTTSFSKIFQKIEERHGQSVQSTSSNQPSNSFSNSQIQPPFLVSSKPIGSTVKLIAPVPLKPQVLPISTCNSIIPSPITTARLTPFRSIEEEAIALIGQMAGSSNDSIQDQFLQYINDSNSRSPLLAAGNATTFSMTMSGLTGLQAPVATTTVGSAANYFSGSNSLTMAMGLIGQPAISLAVSQATTAASSIPLVRMVIPPPASPSASNSSMEAANQAPLTNMPQDPNAPKLPTDFSQALKDENK